MADPAIHEHAANRHYEATGTRRCMATLHLNLQQDIARVECLLPSADVGVTLRQAGRSLLLTLPATGERADISTFPDRRIRWISEREDGQLRLRIGIDDDNLTANDEVWIVEIAALSSDSKVAVMAGDFCHVHSVEADPTVHVAGSQVVSVGQSVDLVGRITKTIAPRGNDPHEGIQATWRSLTGEPEPGETTITTDGDTSVATASVALLGGVGRSLTYELVVNHRPFEVVARTNLLVRRHRLVDQWKLDEAGPVDVAPAHDAQHVYVADGAKNRVLQLTMDGAAVGEWGTQGDGDGQFAVGNPLGIAAGAGGEVYAVDRGHNRVQKFDASGTLLKSWSIAAGNALYAGGIAVSSDRVYVAVAGRGLQVFDLDGRAIADDAGDQTSIRDVAVDSQDNVYIALGADTVRRLGAGPTTEWKISGLTARTVDLQSIAVDSTGFVYASVDFVASSIRAWADRLRERAPFSVSEIGRASFLDRPFPIGPIGPQPPFPFPIPIPLPRPPIRFPPPTLPIPFPPFPDPPPSLGSQLARAMHSCIHKLAPDGGTAYKWGRLSGLELEVTREQFETPRGIGVDPNGRVYVADPSLHRIQVYGR